MNPLLKVDNLTIASKEKTLIEKVSITLSSEEILGLVGPSGIGKSLLAKAIVDLLPPSLTKQGEILFENSPFKKEMRGAKIGLIFQDPTQALNPTMQIGKQISDGLMHHQNLSKYQAKEKALYWMEQLKIDEPLKRYNQYPFQCSGGMLQRLHAASVLALKPKLLIADEITTNLDILTKKQLLNTLKTIIEEEKMALLLITHEKTLVNTFCHRIKTLC